MKWNLYNYTRLKSAVCKSIQPPFLWLQPIAFKVAWWLLSVDLITKYSPPVCNLLSVQIQLFCDDLRGLLRGYRGANSILTTKDRTRQVRDKVVEKFKAGLGCKKISQALNISRSTVQSSMAQLQACQDTAVHLNLQTEHGEHWSEIQSGGLWWL